MVRLRSAPPVAPRRVTPSTDRSGRESTGLVKSVLAQVHHAGHVTDHSFERRVEQRIVQQIGQVVEYRVNQRRNDRLLIEPHVQTFHVLVPDITEVLVLDQEPNPVERSSDDLGDVRVGHRVRDRVQQTHDAVVRFRVHANVLGDLSQFVEYLYADVVRRYVS